MARTLLPTDSPYGSLNAARFPVVQRGQKIPSPAKSELQVRRALRPFKMQRFASNVLRILLLEDSETDAKLIRYELRRAGMVVATERVDSEVAFTNALRVFAPDVVLADHSLAQFDARSALLLLRGLRPMTPLIIVTGSLQLDNAVECLRAGAENVVLKDGLLRLARVIADALSVRRSLACLTARQFQVLRLLAEGHRTKEIASRLEVSTKTIESHRSQVMKRLGAHDLASVVRYAVRVGLIEATAL